MDSPETKTSKTWLDEVVIRELRATDLKALEWEGEYSHFRRMYAKAFERTQLGTALIWVVEDKPGHLIGQVFVLLNSGFDPELADGEHHAFLHSFRVRAEFRNRGLGARLLEVAEDDLRVRGFKLVGLNVADENVDAIRFYERHGYRKLMPISGEWSYVDQHGREQNVSEPGWRLIKNF